MEVTDEDRLALIEYQKGLHFHPYTCPESHGDDHICLVPGKDSWFCPAQTCQYTQTYRHEDLGAVNIVRMAP